MKLLSLILLLSCNVLISQSPMVVEGEGTLATIFLPSNSPEVGYLTFRPSPSILQGYWGVGFNSPVDIEFGSFKTQTKIHLTTKLQPRLSIYPDGSIYINSLSGATTRKVYVTDAGMLEAPSSDNLYNLHHSEFRANDADGEFVKVIKSPGGFEFVQHLGDFGDDGVLVGPISLQSNIRIKSMTVAYINRASDNGVGNKFEVCLQYAKKVPITSQVTNDRTDWTHLPVGGAFVPSSSERFQVESLTIDIPDIITSDDRIYSVLIKCEDCSLQSIKTVNLVYTYN